jgi:hypothetical protein
MHIELLPLHHLTAGSGRNPTFHEALAAQPSNGALQWILLSASVPIDYFASFTCPTGDKSNRSPLGVKYGEARLSDGNNL